MSKTRIVGVDAAGVLTVLMPASFGIGNNYASFIRYYYPAKFAQAAISIWVDVTNLEDISTILEDEDTLLHEDMERAWVLWESK